MGIFNLLPIPALDGGRLVFLLIEAIRRTPIKAKYEGFVHAAGFLPVSYTHLDVYQRQGWRWWPLTR